MTSEEREYFENSTIEEIREDLRKVLKEISVLTFEGFINSSG